MLKRIGKDARKDFCRRIIHISATRGVVHKIRYALGSAEVPPILLKNSKRRELRKAITRGDLDLVKFYHSTLGWHFDKDDLFAALENGDATFEIASFIWESTLDITPLYFLNSMGQNAFLHFADAIPWRVEDIVQAAFYSTRLSKFEHARKMYPSTWREHAVKFMFWGTDRLAIKFPALHWMIRCDYVPKDIDQTTYSRFITCLCSLIMRNDTQGHASQARYLYQLICALNTWVHPSYPGMVCVTLDTCNALRTSTSPFAPLIRKVFSSRQCACNSLQNH